MAVWVKICGITSGDDARVALDAGADAIGLNLVGGPRRITPLRAREIIEDIPADRAVVLLVSLTADGLDPSVGELLATGGVRHLQLYGDVSADNLRAVVAGGGRPLVVCRPKSANLRSELRAAIAGLPTDTAFAIVLDAYAAGTEGGTGLTLDWNAIARAREAGELADMPPLVLAGGLTPANVAEAVRIVRPWGLDVSSGVENAPGHKDRQSLIDFIRNAKSASRQ